MIVLLDSSPLGLATNPNVSAESQECSRWLEQIANSNHLIVIPEIVDYELRRELLRGLLTKVLTILDTLALRFVFAPITTPVMRTAAQLWATARQRGVPTADDKALDRGQLRLPPDDSRYWLGGESRPLRGRAQALGIIKAIQRQFACSREIREGNREPQGGCP